MRGIRGFACEAMVGDHHLVALNTFHDLGHTYFGTRHSSRIDFVFVPQGNEENYVAKMVESFAGREVFSKVDLARAKRREKEKQLTESAALAAGAAEGASPSARGSGGKAPDVRQQFSVAHYAGSVDYTVTGWLEKNRGAVQVPPPPPRTRLRPPPRTEGVQAPPHARRPRSTVTSVRLAAARRSPSWSRWSSRRSARSSRQA